MLNFLHKSGARALQRERLQAGSKLRVVLHVGPHKTGTTSLQEALLKEYGSENPQKIWYPKPAIDGPGHATVARAVLGRKGFPEPQPAIRHQIEQALQSNCAILILSSEDFAHAYPNRLAILAEQTSETDTHIIVTLSPIGRRAVSLWQELVKHRCKTPLQETNAVLRNVGLAPDLTQSLAMSFPKAKISVIISDKTSPTTLYQHFSKATGLSLPLPRVPKELMRNRGLGLIETEVLRAFSIASASTVLPNEKYIVGRKILGSLFKSEKWRSAVPIVPLSLPKDWIEPLAQQCAETIRQLRELQSHNRIEIFGDP